MRSIALGLLLASVAPALAQSPVTPSTQKQIAIPAGTIAASVLITGIAGQGIYVTAVNMIPVATAVVTFTQGTGAACGTNTVNVTGAMTFSAGQILNLGDGYGAVWVTQPGNSLCITVATAGAPGSIAYSQF